MSATPQCAGSGDAVTGARRHPRRPAAPTVVEDSYEPGDVEQAWREYCEAHGQQPYPRDERYDLFRSGWRRGFGQGAAMGTSMFVHTFEVDETDKSAK